MMSKTIVIDNFEYIVRARKDCPKYKNGVCECLTSITKKYGDGICDGICEEGLKMIAKLSNK